ncbi:MAG: hypothetical protein WC548_01380 [Candidatus Pacearchaeota archaeon]
MVLQYKKKHGGRWRDYLGKNTIKGKVDDYDFRLLNKNKNKVLVEKNNYKFIMKRFRQIEFFKHRG